MKKKYQFIIIALLCSGSLAMLLSAGNVSRKENKAFVSLKDSTKDEDEDFELLTTSCGGVERWSVKVLTDNLANTVNFTPIPTTVAHLVAIATPTPSSTMPRYQQVEDSTYVVTCNITIKKAEADSDYHLVLSNGTQTLIGEIPCPNCNSVAASPYVNQFKACRAFIDANIAQGNVMNVNIPPVTVTGVAFIDPPHSQTGAAPNNLELHPILDIHFANSSSPPVAAFSSSGSTVCAGSTVTLTDQSTNNPTSWQWTMTGGTPSSSTQQNPTVVYNSAGTYTVSMKATNASGNSSATHTITVKAAPNVTVSATNPAHCVGSSSTLTASGASTYSWSPSANLSSTTGSSVTANPSGTTVYTVTGTNSSGCTAAKTVTVTVHPLPTVNLALNPDTVCVNANAYALTGGSPSGGTYSGTGVSAGNFNPSVAGTGNHTITYSYTDANGCSNNTTQQIYVNACATAVNEYSIKDISVSVYPNPFSNFTFINISSKSILGDCSFKLFNSLGKEVKEISLHDGNGKVSFILHKEDLKAGVYFYRIEGGNSHCNGKVLIE